MPYIDRDAQDRIRGLYVPEQYEGQEFRANAELDSLSTLQVLGIDAPINRAATVAPAAVREEPLSPVEQLIADNPDVQFMQGASLNQITRDGRDRRDVGTGQTIRRLNALARRLDPDSGMSVVNNFVNSKLPNQFDVMRDLQHETRNLDLGMLSADDAVQLNPRVREALKTSKGDSIGRNNAFAKQFGMPARATRGGPAAPNVGGGGR